MKTSHFPSSCPGHMWGIVAAMIILSNAQSKEMTQQMYFRNDTVKKADAFQAERNGVQQSLVRAQRNDIKIMDPTPSSDSDSQISHPGLYNLTYDVYSSDISDSSNEHVDVVGEKNETHVSDVLPVDGDEQVYDNEESEDIDDEMDFNVTAAIEKGIQAHYELCGSFCEENSTLVVRQGTDHCHFSDTQCYPCSCDHACAKYGDCCPLNGSTSMPQIAVRPHLCLEVNTGRGKNTVEVIATCPDNDSDQGMNCVENCNNSTVNDTDVLNQLVVSLDTHALYCNGDCALCNGETNFTTAMVLECETAYNGPNSRDGSNFKNNDHAPSFQDTEAPLDVSSKRGVTIALNGSDIGQTTGLPFHEDTKPFPPLVNVAQCGLFIPTEHRRFLRMCRSKKASLPTQPQSTRNHTVLSNATDIGVIEDLCFQYSYPVRIGDTIYRNLFCALRDGVAPSGITCHSRVYVVDFPVPGSGSINVLTSLQQPVIVYRVPTFSFPECLDGDGWYDVAIDKCRPVSCENGREWLTGQPFCVHAVPRTNTTIVYTYILYVVFQPRVNSTKFGCSSYWAHVHDGAVNHLAGIMQQLNVTIFAIQMQCDFNLSKMFVYVEFMVESADGEGQIEFELKVLEKFAVSRLPVSVVSGVQLDVTLTSGFRNWEAQQTWISFFNGSCCDQTIFCHGLDLVSLYSNITTDPHPYYTRAVLGPFTPYAQVLLNVTEFDRVMDDQYNLTYANISLAARNVLETDNGLVVPFLFLQDTYIQAGLVQNPQPQIEIRYRSEGIEYRILAMCCLIVSIINLVFLLTTYSVFPELRTLPGINTMFLASWLLMAQLLLLVVPDKTEVAPVCQALGMVLHYSWLCVVSWSSVCSFHTFDVFVRQQNRMHMPHRQGWYIKRYVAVAHSLPALVLLLVVVCMTARTGGHDVGYGGHVCYLNSVLLVGLAFILPLALSVLFNLVLLILTARAVSLVKRQHVSAATGAERGGIQIYIGLSSLTGLCWVVALIAEVPGCGWLRYVSAVLNGLQGLHLALSYAGSKRVMKMWRHKLRCSAKTSRSQRSTSRSSSSTQSRRTVRTSV